jgi:hypothetical protein
VFNLNSPSKASKSDKISLQKNLLDMVSTHMPRLSRLSISLSTEAIWNSRPGTRIFTPVIECLLAYSIPPSATIVQLPTVMIDSRRFEPNFPSPSPDEAVGGERGRRYEETEEEEDVFINDDSEE